MSGGKDLGGKKDLGRERISAAEMRVNLSHCHYPVRGLGYGRRVGVWMQGCSIHCPGCVVPETWEARAEHSVPLTCLVARLLDWTDGADGVTISGGEPFDQPEALLGLVSALRTACRGDILVYSGRPWATLAARHAAILSRVDVVVSEPFVADRREDLPLIGSANQRVNLLTPLAEERYGDWRGFEREAGVCVRGGVLYLAAIPRRGELAGLARELNTGNRLAELTHDPI